jgi:hypothetical protein
MTKTLSIRAKLSGVVTLWGTDGISPNEHRLRTSADSRLGRLISGRLANLNRTVNTASLALGETPSV